MKPKPIPQYDLPFARDTFNLYSEETQDGERIAKEREQREHDLEQAKKQQNDLPIFA